MILLLSIFKKNKHYCVSVIDTEKDANFVDYRVVNAYLLNECNNVYTQNFISSKQNPLEYLRGDYDISKLLINESQIKEKEKDFQIMSVYYDGDKPLLYRAIDRCGNITIHDISELEYGNHSIFGNDINALPKFVERKPIESAQEYLENLNEEDLKLMPCGLLKQYLINVKNFKEGYHTVTKVNNGIKIDVHEHMLFSGSATLKLIEYIPENKNIYLTKQDSISNPYPMERTAGFLPGSIVLVASSSLLPTYTQKNYEYTINLFNKKALTFSLPFTPRNLTLFDRFYKSKRMYYGWCLNCKENMSTDTYKNILPNEIFKLPNSFYYEMKNKPFNLNNAASLGRENDNIEMWIYTVALFFCLQIYSQQFKTKIKPILNSYKEMYQLVLNNLVSDLGPRDALYVMKWTQNHLKEAMHNILNVPSSGDLMPSGADEIEEASCFFTFFQNTYDLPECLRIYSTETINRFGGYEELKNAFETANVNNKRFIINSLEALEKEVNKEQNEKNLTTNIDTELKKLIK